MKDRVLTPIEIVDQIITENEAKDPDFYADPDEPTTTALAAALTVNERRHSASSNTKFYATKEAAWHPYGLYGPDNSPLPIATRPDPSRTEIR